MLNGNINIIFGGYKIAGWVLQKTAGQKEYMDSRELCRFCLSAEEFRRDERLQVSFNKEVVTH